MSRTVFESQYFLDAWDTYDNLGGWLKAPAQIMQSMIHGVGLYDTCDSAPPPGACTGLFCDGFESGDTDAWSSTVRNP